MAENPGINHDTAAKLLGLTPGELTALVNKGIITRTGKDSYSLALIVRDYIAHLKKPSLIWSQTEIAEHLDTSDRTIRELQDKLGINCKTNTVDEIRIAYIRHLREQAAGRATTGDLDLATERAALAREQRIRIEMQNAVTRREFGPVEAIEFGLTELMVRVASQLDTIPGKVKKASDKLTASDIDIVASVIAEVRNDITSLHIDWFDDKDSDEEGDIDVELDS
jgi:phage terminase Nu1 subunit (DNA packaging protein)